MLVEEKHVNKSTTPRFIRALLLSLSAAAMLQGCLPGTHGSIIEPAQRAAIVRGQTTKDQVLNELGSPDDEVDLGGGKEEISYIQETVPNRANFNLLRNSSKSQFWILLNNNVVEAYGDRTTDKSPNYFKWPF